MKTQNIIFNPKVNLVSKKANTAPKVQFASIPDVFIKNAKCDVSFNGLTRDMGKRAYPTLEAIQAKIEQHPKSNGIVGNLPNEWLEKIPQSHRGETIKQLYKSIGEVALELRKKENSKEAVVSASQKINEALHIVGIIEPEQKIKLKKLEAGAYGTGYLLEQNTPTKDKFIIKIFHDIEPTLDIHGNYIEQNRAMFWQKNTTKNNNRAKSYFMDLKNGYMINQFIGILTPLPKKRVNESRLGLFANDETGNHNIINGYSIDYGGLEIKTPILDNNKEARYTYKKITNAPYSEKLGVWNQIYENKSVPNYTQKLEGLIPAVNLITGSNNKLECFDKLLKVPDMNLKAALCKNIDVLPFNMRAPWFDNRLHNADSATKKALAHSLKVLSKEPKGDNLARFEKLMNGSDSETQVLLAENLKLLEPEQKTKWFKKLAQLAVQNQDNKLKSQLTRQLSNIADEDKAGWFEQFYKDSDIKVKTSLATHIEQLPNSPANDRVDWYHKLAADALKCEDGYKKLTLALCNNLYILTGKDCEQHYNKFLEIANNSIKSKLAFNLDVLPQDSQPKFFKKIAKVSDNKIKLELAVHLRHIPEESQIDCFKSLIIDADEVLKTKLQKKIKNFPEELKQKCNQLLKKQDKNAA